MKKIIIALAIGCTFNHLAIAKAPTKKNPAFLYETATAQLASLTTQHKQETKQVQAHRQTEETEKKGLMSLLNVDCWKNILPEWLAACPKPTDSVARKVKLLAEQHDSNVKSLAHVTTCLSSVPTTLETAQRFFKEHAAEYAIIKGKLEHDKMLTKEEFSLLKQGMLLHTPLESLDACLENAPIMNFEDEKSFSVASYSSTFTEAIKKQAATAREAIKEIDRLKREQNMRQFFDSIKELYGDNPKTILAIATVMGCALVHSACQVMRKII